PGRLPLRVLCLAAGQRSFVSSRRHTRDYGFAVDGDITGSTGTLACALYFESNIRAQPRVAVLLTLPASALDHGHSSGLATKPATTGLRSMAAAQVAQALLPVRFILNRSEERRVGKACMCMVATR